MSIYSAADLELFALAKKRGCTIYEIIEEQEIAADMGDL